MNGNTITAKTGFTWVFGQKKLIGQYSFTAKFNKIGNYVGFGVADIQNKNIGKSDNWNKNHIRYQNTGICYVSEIKVGEISTGFKTGENVTVTIDLNSGSIQWRVNSEIRH